MEEGLWTSAPNVEDEKHFSYFFFFSLSLRASPSAGLSVLIFENRYMQVSMFAGAEYGEHGNDYIDHQQLLKKPQQEGLSSTAQPHITLLQSYNADINWT